MINVNIEIAFLPDTDINDTDTDINVYYMLYNVFIIYINIYKNKYTPNVSKICSFDVHVGFQ